ncbi:MAG: calcium/sodium antiporter [Kiritimatiellae bacterium]|nr:calcium/sodium antiporter [Kiritimatiellia bacterium]
MYPDIPIYLACLFVAGGLYLLAKSADWFVDGAAAFARWAGLSPLVVGMVVIGFGTSAPELCVSVLSGLSHHSDLSLGNAYGSSIFNIAFILGLAAVLRPLKVKPRVATVSSALLVAISLFSCMLVGEGEGFSRADGLLSLAVFAVLMPLYCWFDSKNNPPHATAHREEARERIAPMLASLFGGLAVLVASSHVLVWGSVQIAKAMGVSELVIGLTIVAVGTSLPEVASAVASARKGENEFVLGNIIGSNFFNTLAVVGLAGAISPFKHVSRYILLRDMPVMVAASATIFLFGFNFANPRKHGRIGRIKGVIWLATMAAYFAVMLWQELHNQT